MQSERIKSIIVDDEPDARESLEILLMDIPKIEIIGQFGAVVPAIDFITSHQPRLVFLDIDMPGKNGFDFITELKDLHLHPNIIFITAYPEHAIEAIEEAAFGYLLKPIDPDKLRRVVNRFICEQQNHTEKTEPKKLKFNTRCGFILIDPNEVVYCQAAINYTDIVLTTGKQVTVTQNLGAIEPHFSFHPHYRLGRSHILNIEYVRNVNRKDRTCVLNFNGKEAKLKISKQQLIDLEKLIFKE